LTTTDIHHVEKLTPLSLGGLRVEPVTETPLRFNLLIYGDPGVGKTVLAGSACVVPEMSPVLLLDIEGGTLSLRKRYPEVDTVRVSNWAQLVRVYEALKEGEGKDYYRTIVIDSLTESQKVGMATIMKRAVEKDEDRDPDLPGIGEWGKNTNQVRTMVRAFRDLPMNTIFTCLAQTDKDKKGRWLTRPSLSGKLASEVSGFMDVVLYMYNKDNEDSNLPPHRLLLSRKTEEVIAKDRTDRLPPVVGGEDVPTIQMLHDIMFS